MTTLAYSDAVRVAMARVDLTPEAVVDVLGSCLEGEHVYLVGSLAAGLGNAESDIDLHVFVTEAAAGLVPMLFFAGRTRLDLVTHEVGAPAAARAKLPTTSVPLAGGRCALGALPGMTDLKRLSRWATAVPLHDGSPPLFDDEGAALVAAAVVRAALDTSVRAGALASVLEAAGAPFAPLAWSRAAEQAVEVLVRAAGHVFVGDKWLPAKARRCGISPAVLATARRATDGAAYDRFVADLGLPVDRPAEVVRVDAADAPAFTFGSRSYRLVGGRLAPPVTAPSPGLAECVAATGPRALADAFAAGAVSITVDAAAVDGRLA